MDSQGKPRPTQEKTSPMEWVLCSPHFKDVVLITQKDLSSIPITSQYKEITLKQIQKHISKWTAPGCTRQKEETQNYPLKNQERLKINNKLSKC